MNQYQFREAILSAKRVVRLPSIRQNCVIQHIHELPPLEINGKYDLFAPVQRESCSMDVNYWIVEGNPPLMWCFCEKEKVFFWDGWERDLEMARHEAEIWRARLVEAHLEWEEQRASA